MNWRRRRAGAQVAIVSYGRNGKLHRRTVTLYPPAPVPANCLDWMPTAFERLDREMDQYLAEVARERAERAAGEEAA